MSRPARYVVKLVACPGTLTKELRDVVYRLDRKTFPPPDKRVDLTDVYVWLAYDDRGRAVAYAGLRLKNEQNAMLVRAGVLPAHRKQGLHRRLVTARLRYARRLGCKYAVTYTTAGNSRSINALTGRGFRAVAPPDSVADRFCFWRKVLVPEVGDG